jgi:putative membrane protein
MMAVATDDSLNQLMNNAKRHYASLFFLPSFKKALVAIAIMCTIAGVSSIALFPSVDGLINGLLLAVALFTVNFFFDWVISKAVLGDPIFILRRTVALSYFGWILWLFFIIIGVVFGVAFTFLWWVKLCLLGFAALLTLRAVVFFAASPASSARRLVAVLLSPLSCILPFVALWANLNVAPIDYLPFLVVSPIVACGAAALFVSLLDRMGQKMYNISSMTIFKAFMLNWVSALNDPLEAFFEKLGEDKDVEVSFLKFDSSKPKAAIIVPLVHPGPFKNIGSSLLPSLLKHDYEKEYGGDACVPLGLLGHELDAASQAQNHKIINHILQAAKIPSSIDRATQFVRVSEGFVTASCQIFGKTALLSFTLAPKTTEDLPQELGGIVRKEAEKLGLDHAIVVNAHNSLTSNVNIEASIETLRAAAAKCLQKAVSLPSYPFEVGAATVYPTEFTLKDGMGTGGITAIVVKVVEQKTAYVIIDGNNMISGLREKILSTLTAEGFQESEVFTTDTHAVSAVVLGHRGYHPVGEAMNQDTLISYIKNVAQTAAGQLETCKAGYLSTMVPKVRVIGGGCLASLTVLVDKTLQKAKRIVVPIFAAEGLLLILLLSLL